MNGWLRDLLYAFRQLKRAPGFATAAVFTLALGIGASAAIFCLMDGLWLHPMPVPQSGRLARVFATTPQSQEGLFSYPEFQTLEQRASAFSGLAAIGGRGSLMPNADGTSTLLLTYVVSDNFFEVLKLQPLIGRVFTSADAQRLRSHPGVLLGYRCWQRYFGGDPNIVGRQIPLRHGKDRINQVDVWGVLPPSFRDVDANGDRDLWMPAETWAANISPAELTSVEFRWFNLIGRLAPGSTVAQANQQVVSIAKTMAIADRVHNHDRGARAISDLDYRLSNAGTTGQVLLGIVLGVVLLATVNVGHLLLARGLARQADVALRLSLGGKRWDIARQLLLENLIIGVLGLSLSLVLAAGIAFALPHLLVLEPAMLVSLGSATSFHLDWRVLCFAAGLALVSMLFLAAVPLGMAARTELLPALQARAITRTAGKTTLARRLAITLQIGISFALLVSTGALVRSFLHTRTQPIGVTRDQVLVAFTQDPDAPMRNALMTQMRALPGVESVAYGIRSPLMLSEGGLSVKALLPGHPELRDPIEIRTNAVGPGFLGVVGTRILQGRDFTEADDQNGPATVLISQAMAQKYWPGKNPIGETVRLTNLPEAKGALVDARIIGVTENAPINQIGEIPEPYIYLPFHLYPEGEVTFVVRTRQNAMSLAQDVRQVLIHTNPLLDPMMVTSLPELIRYSAGNYQMMAELVSALGLIGLALTIVGLYGFLAFRVTQRKREIGIRMALGASRQGTAGLVLRDTARLAAGGLAAGLVLAIAAGRIEASVLFGVHAFDVWSLAGALTFVAVASCAAAWLPARRAAAVEPMQALRAE